MILISGSDFTDSVTQFIVVTLVFVFVLGITFLTTHFIGSHQKKQMTQGNIKIVDSLRINNSKVLEIVTVGDKYFLIAVCKDTVTTIGEIDGNSLELQSEKDGSSFGSVFSRFKVVNRKESNEEDDTEDED